MYGVKRLFEPVDDGPYRLDLGANSRDAELMDLSSITRPL